MPPSTPPTANQESSHHTNHSSSSSRPHQQQSLRSGTFDPLITSFRKLLRGATHSKPSSEPQDSSANLRLYGETGESLPSNTRAIDQGIGATLQDAHHFSISGNARIVNIGQQVNNRGTSGSNSNFSAPSSSNIPIKSSQGLDNLKEFVSFSALHDSSAQDPERCCHPGTRKNVLNKMRTWMDDSNTPERILWLNGPAGVGKSAITQTISYSYDQDKVGATFFFSRSDPIRNDGNRLFPTLAWQLALSVPVVNDLISFSLDKYPDLPRKAIEVQFNKLITQPFLTIPGGESAAPISTRVIIIDGLDECSDVKLQERILRLIGNAVADARFPLHFLISSRPEAHIQDFFDQFQHPTLQIDLANVDDAFRDIETYLSSEFARIAAEQKLDPSAWPAQGIIDTLVSKSSGQFVYASTVIKNVGDKYESAVTQLNVILGLKPSNGQSPFSELDALYIEILHRQPDKNFMKEFLSVLVVRSMLSGVKDGNLHEDDAMLLGLDDTQLQRKLRGMYSLLKFKPFIDVHHKSFLDFLLDSSRSSEYHVSKHFANRRYMELITGALVKTASKAMTQPDSHEDDHVKPRFATLIRHFPLPIELPLDDLAKILQPLLIIQENLLQLPNMSVPWKPRACDECWTFFMIDDLVLHLALYRGNFQLQEPKYVGIHPLTAMEEKQSIPRFDLDACLSLLLTHLKGVQSQISLDVDIIGLVRALVRFDPTETAMKIRSITDAQNIVDLIFCLNKNKCFKSWFGAAAHHAMQLAVTIYGRVPLLPRPLFLSGADLDRVKGTYRGKTVKIWDINHSVWRDCFDAFMWGSLFHGNIEPLLGICSFQSSLVKVSQLPNNGTLREWRCTSNPSVSEILQTLFEVAAAVQYIHSLGIVLGYRINADNVYLDFDKHVKLQCSRLHPNDLACKGQIDYDGIGMICTLEADIRDFGLLFYDILFNEEVRRKPNIRPKEPETPDNVWHLIQWCCAKDPKRRPTMDQVVREMESGISLESTLSS